jgi:hypothetical protein
MVVAASAFIQLFCCCLVVVLLLRQAGHQGPSPPAAAAAAAAAADEDGTAGTCSSSISSSSSSSSCGEGATEGCDGGGGDDFEFGEEKPGIQVINAILANMWPPMSNSLLEDMRANPLLADPYILKVKRGKFRYAPTIRGIKLLSDPPPPAASSGDRVGGYDASSLPPPRFQCAIAYRGRPGLDLVLTGADAYNRTAPGKVVAGVFKRLMRRLVPDIFVEVKSVDLEAQIEVELDLRGGPAENTLEFFFVGRPRVEWDLEFSLTKLEIPLVGEDSLDTILTRAMEGMDRDNPVRVKF